MTEEDKDVQPELVLEVKEADCYFIRDGTTKLVDKGKVEFSMLRPKGKKPKKEDDDVCLIHMKNVRIHIDSTVPAVRMAGSKSFIFPTEDGFHALFMPKLTSEEQKHLDSLLQAHSFILSEEEFHSQNSKQTLAEKITQKSQLLAVKIQTASTNYKNTGEKGHVRVPLGIKMRVKWMKFSSGMGVALLDTAWDIASKNVKGQASKGAKKIASKIPDVIKDKISSKIHDKITPTVDEKNKDEPDAIGSVLVALLDAGSLLTNTIGSSTSDVMQHKYGDEVLNVSKDVGQTTVNIAIIASEAPLPVGVGAQAGKKVAVVAGKKLVKKLVKKVVKKAAKKALKEGGKKGVKKTVKKLKKIKKVVKQLMDELGIDEKTATEQINIRIANERQRLAEKHERFDEKRYEEEVEVEVEVEVDEEQDEKEGDGEMVEVEVEEEVEVEVEVDEAPKEQVHPKEEKLPSSCCIIL